MEHSDSDSHAEKLSRTAFVIAGLAIVLIAIFLLSLALGSVWIPVHEIVAVLTGNVVKRTSYVVIQNVRLPRSLTAMLAGAALGIAGLQMQTLFRNPLADPFVLGIASGASLGVAIVVMGSGTMVGALFGVNLGFAGDAAITVAAIVGAGLVMTIVLAFSNRIANPATVLILGLMFGYVAAAFVTVIVAGTEADQLQRWAAWGFGSFSGVPWERLEIFAPVIFAGLLVACLTTKQLNALLLGENYARSMGLAVRRVRWITILGASVLGGGVTAFCGPISFLGIAIPHMCRALLGTSDHRLLVPAVILMGGILALVAQIASLLPGDAGVLPLNAVTALIGAPIVVMVLLRSRRGVFTA